MHVKVGTRAATHFPPATVIVAAHNEANNVQTLLQALSQQRYPDFSIIVVDDHSDDATLTLLRDFAAENNRHHASPHISVLQNRDHKGKKHALTQAIQHADTEHLLFIDADCQPASDLWLPTFMRHFDDDTAIIVGYGAYERRPGLANAFIRYDTEIIALTYLNAVVLGRPFMAVGRNFAYKKTLWESVGGFTKHIQTVSGDDDLFMATAATAQNTKICLAPDAFTTSIPAKTLSGYLNQKRRHVTTAPHYSLISLFLAGGEMLSRTIFYCTVFFAFTPMAAAVCVAIRLIINTLVLTKVLKKIKSTISFVYLIIFDIFAVLIYICIFIRYIIGLLKR